jgi:hypothetical protein
MHTLCLWSTVRAADKTKTEEGVFLTWSSACRICRLSLPPGGTGVPVSSSRHCVLNFWPSYVINRKKHAVENESRFTLARLALAQTSTVWRANRLQLSMRQAGQLSTALYSLLITLTGTTSGIHLHRLPSTESWLVRTQTLAVFNPAAFAAGALFLPPNGVNRAPHLKAPTSSSCHPFNRKVWERGNSKPFPLSTLSGRLTGCPPPIFR